MKALSTTIALLSALTPLSLPVAAQEIHTGGHVDGWEVMYIVEGATMSDVDTLAIDGPYGVEQIKVVCSPFDWKSTGPNTSQWVDRIARRWCF